MTRREFLLTALAAVACLVLPPVTAEAQVIRYSKSVRLSTGYYAAPAYYGTGAVYYTAPAAFNVGAVYYTAPAAYSMSAVYYSTPTYYNTGTVFYATPAYSAGAVYYATPAYGGVRAGVCVSS
jgi:hypothetical protein